MNDLESIYKALNFPEPADRPYTFINMVATIDGKTTSGNRGEDVTDLGGKGDHVLMRRIEDQADGVLIGATTLRATDKRWDPGTPVRVVVSNKGDFDYGQPFFHGNGKGYVACSESATFQPEQGVQKLIAGKDKVDVALLLKELRKLRVRHLLCFGGSELNAQLLSRDLIDELFLTIAPKIKLGREIPTYAGGDPLPRDHMLHFHLAESHAVGDEVFLRYKRRPAN